MTLDVLDKLLRLLLQKSLIYYMIWWYRTKYAQDCWYCMYLKEPMHTFTHQHLNMKNLFASWAPRLVTGFGRIHIFIVTVSWVRFEFTTKCTNDQFKQWAASGDSATRRVKTLPSLGEGMTAFIWNVTQLIRKRWKL